MRHHWAVALLMAASLAAYGCGGGDKGGKVTGSVTLGGAAQTGVVVGFVPVAGAKSPSQGAKTDSSGKFETTLLPGKYAVILSRKVDASGNVPGAGVDVGQLEADGQLHESMPANYTAPDTTPLAAEIPVEGKDLEPFVVQSR